MSIEEKFFKENPRELINNYQSIGASQWERLGEAFALDLFQKASQKIPAYKDFLKKHKINPEKIKTKEDFELLPLVDKKNYLQAYPLKSLTWEDDLSKLYTLSSSSGSSGTPYLWPRGSMQEVEGARFSELFYKYLFGMDKKSTLYVVSFGMGAWIAGSFMTSVTQLISRKGYPILVITPGLEKDLLIKMIKDLSPNFDQVLIIGYPPFVKDILDSGKTHNLDWKEINMKLMFAAEGFSEKWRDYMLRKIGEKNPLKTTTNIYGTADAGIMGMETPLSILLRKVLIKSGKVEQFFGQNRLPTIVQYDPTTKYFEKVQNELVFTSNSGIPLIKYNIHDHGNIIHYEQVKEAIEDNSIGMYKELKKYNVEDFDWKIPFVYIFGRTDFMVNFYGLNIFPEHIKSGLEDSRVSNYVSGKFTMQTLTNKKHNQKLILNIELQNNTEPNKHLKKQVSKSMLDNLTQRNSEFNKLYNDLGPKKATPEINLFPYGDSQFKVGIKHNWVKNKSK